MTRQKLFSVHIAKRTLINPCELCWEEIKKGEEYYIRNYVNMGRKVEHVACNQQCVGCYNIKKCTDSSLCSSCRSTLEHRNRFKGDMK